MFPLVTAGVNLTILVCHRLSSGISSSMLEV